MGELLRIEHLSKTFGKRKILDDICLSVDEGDIYGILGLSGAGKSTLVRCINGLEKNDEGTIFYNNEPSKFDRMYRKEVAMIFQSFNLLDQRTVLKNIELAGEIFKTPNYHEKALKLLDLVGLKDKANCYPSTLSGGEKQRVAIARALLNEPKILLCDEATSALDVATTRSILSFLKELNKELNLTIIIIAHQLEVIEQICNKVAIIDNSKIIEQGPTDEIFLSPKSEIGKKLIYEGHINFSSEDKNLIKIIFKEGVTESLVSTLIKDLNLDLSIVYADSKVVNNHTVGQMIISLNNHDKDIDKLRKYLKDKSVMFEEVSYDNR